MEKKLTRYKCIECGKEFVFKEKDGITCPECKGYLNPMGHAEAHTCVIGETHEDRKRTNVRKEGLTEQEGKVMDALVIAWNEFIKLGMTHPSDMTSFCNGIHQCQQILGMRVLQRDYPEGWPTKKGANTPPTE